MGAEEKKDVRQPCVAGKFYPGTPDALLRQLNKLIKKNLSKEKCLGVVSPHAGYVYSGPVAGELYSRIELPDTMILIGPNHTGIGSPFSIMSEGAWITPLGTVAIDEKLAKEIGGTSRYIKDDFQAHRYEHSLEVQLPFIQYLKKDFSIIPIIVGAAELSVCREIGEEIARAVILSKRRPLIVASSDMTHYEPLSEAEKKDRLAIEAIIQLAEALLYERIDTYDISMCGYVPCIIMLSAVKKMGAKTAELVRYQTSGDASGDYDSVVGYAGIMIK